VARLSSFDNLDEFWQVQSLCSTRAMGRGKTVLPQERAHILAMIRGGESNEAIASDTGRSTDVVRRLRKKLNAASEPCEAANGQGNSYTVATDAEEQELQPTPARETLDSVAPLRSGPPEQVPVSVSESTTTSGTRGRAATAWRISCRAQQRTSNQPQHRDGRHRPRTAAVPVRARWSSVVVVGLRPWAPATQETEESALAR